MAVEMERKRHLVNGINRAKLEGIERCYTVQGERGSMEDYSQVPGLAKRMDGDVTKEDKEQTVWTSESYLSSNDEDVQKHI